MTNTRKVLLTSLALLLAAGLFIPTAQAENGLRFRSFAIHAPATDAIPSAAAPLIQQGMTAMGPTPPVTGVVGGVQTGVPSWPCFPATAPCSSDPAGGYLGAEPEGIFTIADCETAYDTDNGTGGCGQLWWTFETSSSLTCPRAGCPLSVAITATQGTSTIYSLPLTNIGTLPSPASEGGPYVEVIYGQQGFGTTWGATVDPIMGPVTIAVTTQVIAGTTTKTTVTAKGALLVGVH